MNRVTQEKTESFELAKTGAYCAGKLKIWNTIQLSPEKLADRNVALGPHLPGTACVQHHVTS
jgi:hypothetical protein